MSRIHVLGITGIGLLAAAIVAACAPLPAALCATPEDECDDGTCAADDDDDNCGTCGNTCDSTEECVAGACVPDCEGGEVLCPAADEDDDPTCADLDDNAAHCGACGDACATGEICEEGACEIAA